MVESGRRPSFWSCMAFICDHENLNAIAERPMLMAECRNGFKLIHNLSTVPVMKGLYEQKELLGIKALQRRRRKASFKFLPNFPKTTYRTGAAT